VLGWRGKETWLWRGELTRYELGGMKQSDETSGEEATIFYFGGFRVLDMLVTQLQSITFPSENWEKSPWRL
jgi:hypothetical protein